MNRSELLIFTVEYLCCLSNKSKEEEDEQDELTFLITSDIYGLLCVQL